MYRKFEGALNGITLDELKHLFFENYYNQGHSADDRVDDVKRFLKEHNNNFLEDYCNFQYLAKTPANQVMSENDSVCHFMEMLSNYICLGDSDKFPLDRNSFARDL